jgi:hypothetical protein
MRNGAAYLATRVSSESSCITPTIKGHYLANNQLAGMTSRDRPLYSSLSPPYGGDDAAAGGQITGLQAIAYAADALRAVSPVRARIGRLQNHLFKR